MRSQPPSSSVQRAGGAGAESAAHRNGGQRVRGADCPTRTEYFGDESSGTAYPEYHAGDWFLGMPVRKCCGHRRSPRLVNRPNDYIDEIIEYHQTHLSFKKITINLRDEVIGYVLTFLNANQIQETEGKKKRKSFTIKGHTAKYTLTVSSGKARRFGSASAGRMRLRKPIPIL